VPVLLVPATVQKRIKKNSGPARVAMVGGTRDGSSRGVTRPGRDGVPCKCLETGGQCWLLDARDVSWLLAARDVREDS